MDEIGKMLNVATSTVSRDLRGFADAKPDPARGGRPRKGDKGSEPQPKPEPQPEPLPEPEPVEEQPASPTLTVVPEPQPEPEPESTGSFSARVIAPMLGQIDHQLDMLADHVMGLDHDGKLTVFDEHIEALKGVSKNWNRTMNALNAADKKRQQGQG